MLEALAAGIEWASVLTGGAFVVCVFWFAKWLDDI